VLVVTTTVGVIDWVHSNTTSLWPAVPLDSVLVVGGTGLEHGLVDTSTTGNDTDGCTSVGSDDLLCTGRHLQTGLASVDVVTDDGSVVARGARERSAVSGLLLDVAHNCTLGKRAEGEDVADGERSLLAAVDERTGGETLGRDEGLGAELVAVRVTEDDAGQRGTTSWLVDDLLYEATDIAMLLAKVEVTELGRRNPRGGVGLEDTARLSLVSDDSTHCCRLMV